MTGIRTTDAMDTALARPSFWSRRGRLLALVAGGLALAVALGTPAALRWARADRSVDLARLRLGTVERGDLSRDAAVQGRVVAAHHPRLYSPARGTVEMLVRPGDLVRRGQVLARVESPELAAELESERSLLTSLASELGRGRIAARQRTMENAQEVERLTVAAAAAERELGRARTLRAEGLLNSVELDRAADALALARLTLEQARQTAAFATEAGEFELADTAAQVERQRLAVAELERRLDELTLAAPFDGLVGSLDAEHRDAVAQNQPLLTVIDLSEYEVEVGIPEVYADDVAAGTRAVVLYDARRFPAEVTAVSPAVDGGQVEGRLAFVGEPPPGLRQNQRVSVRLVFESRRGVLKLPRGPFYESGGGRVAYVLEDGLAVRRAIETGAASVAEIEVVSGLAEGDRVVLDDVTAFGGAEAVWIRD